MTDSIYTDEEIRMKVLPLAVQLVDNDFRRGLTHDNTRLIKDITFELANIIRYGEVNAPEAEKPKEKAKKKSSSKKSDKLKYA